MITIPNKIPIHDIVNTCVICSNSMGLIKSSSITFREALLCIIFNRTWTPFSRNLIKLLIYCKCSSRFKTKIYKVKTEPLLEYLCERAVSSDNHGIREWAKTSGNFKNSTWYSVLSDFVILTFHDQFFVAHTFQRFFKIFSLHECCKIFVNAIIEGFLIVYL